MKPSHHARELVSRELAVSADLFDLGLEVPPRYTMQGEKRNRVLQYEPPRDLEARSWGLQIVADIMASHRVKRFVYSAEFRTLDGIFSFCVGPDQIIGAVRMAIKGRRLGPVRWIGPEYISQDIVDLLPLDGVPMAQSRGEMVKRLFKAEDQLTFGEPIILRVNGRGDAVAEFRVA